MPPKNKTSGGSKAGKTSKNDDGDTKGKAEKKAGTAVKVHISFSLIRNFKNNIAHI